MNGYSLHITNKVVISVVSYIERKREKKVRLDFIPDTLTEDSA